MNTLFCILGRTCAGKDTFATRLCKEFPDLFSQVVSYTTRPQRLNETNGVEHYFVSEEEFEKLHVNSDILAYTKIGDYQYMATADELSKGHNVYIIDPVGLRDLRETHPDIRTFAIYLKVSTKVRRERAIASNRYSEEEAGKIFDKRNKEENLMFTKFEITPYTYDVKIEPDMDPLTYRVFLDRAMFSSRTNR